MMSRAYERDALSEVVLISVSFKLQKISLLRPVAPLSAMRCLPGFRILALFAAGLFALTPRSAAAQSSLDRVLAFPPPISGEILPSDQGAAGAWHRINKLGTTASLLHVLAHPDDEHSGMLAVSSRKWGARTSQLSLNRGEAGANAIGPELFDALGMIRTRELALAGRYYGLDDLYFTRAVDYGYSKTLDEALRSWDPEVVLEDMVRVIRLNRPIAVASRFYGDRRDGHGHHQASGVLTPQAVAAAGDPARFPEQISEEGLRPWSAPMLFRGGAADDEPHHVMLDAREYSPLLGVSYGDYARYGLSLQRSQTSGRIRSWGSRTYRYERLGEVPPEAENRVSDTFFEGVDTSLPGLPALVGEEASPEMAASLAELQDLIDGVKRDFDFLAPEQSVPELARGLLLARAAVETAREHLPETAFQLAVKERQFEEAIIAAAGVRIRAELADQALGAALVRYQEAVVRVAVESEWPDRISVREALVLERNREGFAVLAQSDEGAGNEMDLMIRVGSDETIFDGPYFGRSSPTENMYRISDAASAMHLPWRPMALSVQVQLAVGGADIVRTMPITGYVSRLPYGFLARRVEILPDVSVSVSPRVRVAPVEEGAGAAGAIPVLVRVEAIADSVDADIAIELPEGWTSDPVRAPYAFRNRGATVEVRFMARPPENWSGEAKIRAVVASGEGGYAQYRHGYQVIEHRDLPLARLRIPAETTILTVPVARLDGMRVGYVMGVGDEVPAAIETLGASVQLLGEADLASGSLDDFDAIMIGTRAYAVRQDLVEHNRRLLDYASAGGNLIVLYQTQEFVPDEMAPYPAELPRGAQEVSEQDSPVRILAPDHPLLTTPNAISAADFDHWIEQRGSKFFTEWDAAYTPLVETQDTGQDPQQGIWLVAQVGAGHYSYLSLALHRQVPYGVPGAFRILSNAIALGGPSGR